jgi:hypothetical protein
MEPEAVRDEERALIKNMGERLFLEVTHGVAGKFGVAESGYVVKLTRMRWAVRGCHELTR